MANENWEEISEFEIEEDIDLAQRITVHSVHSIDDDEEYQLIQAYKQPTYAAAAKWGGRKSSTSNSVASKPNKTSLKKKKSSTSPKNPKNDDDDDNKSTDTILKGDHNVDYDTLDHISDPSESKTWKETRRNNTKLHKTHSQKLMTSLISSAELESNQDLVKGDTNRNPEFKKYKLLKKTMALNKKHSEKSKNDRKTLRVEVW